MGIKPNFNNFALNRNDFISKEKCMEIEEAIR